MATYAEYHTIPTMSSSNIDFTLFPGAYQESWSQELPYIPASTYADQSYLTATATTFDSYDAKSQNYAPTSNPFGFQNRSYDQSQSHLQESQNTFSPANSASHSLELPLAPVLSSTSDSGHSTISSAVGSPLTQPQAHEWNASQNIFPGIVQQHEGAYPQSTTYDHEAIPDKNCVGESSSFSSFPSQPSQTASPVNVSYFHSTPPRSIPSPSPTSIGLSRDSSLEIATPNDATFLPPMAPASATSPVLERVKGKWRHTPTPKRSASSPNSAPFLHQPGGYFVPPLESSYPSLTCLQPYSPTQFTGAQFPDMQTAVSSPHHYGYSHAPSPALSKTSVPSPQQSNVATTSSASPYINQQSWQSYPRPAGGRRNSISSVHSRHSQGSLGSDDSNKGLCLIPTCGRQVKDLRAHMLTHQNERPEKCPIPTCEYHIKGFARKYDKNRHTLTHYKGTMVCGFCPGSGSAAEKSFNRADVFKRHLTSVHNVEQTPPNARRKSPSSSKQRPYNSREVSGMCSTCGNTFANAQDFYEHLDDCVLRVVQQADPSEAVNEKLLTSMVEDKQVQETLEKHMLPVTIDHKAANFEDEDDEEEEAEDDDTNDSSYGGRSGRSGKGSIKSRKNGTQSIHPRSAGASTGVHSHVSSSGAVSKPARKGLTYSANGVPLAAAAVGKGRRRRDDFPLSWGTSPENMRMKKRVLCVYDGPRRLVKDDMMLDNDHEVRIPITTMAGALTGGRAPYITDLDEQTLLRAEGFLNATEEEKDGSEAVMKRLMGVEQD